MELTKVKNYEKAKLNPENYELCHKMELYYDDGRRRSPQMSFTAREIKAMGCYNGEENFLYIPKKDYLKIMEGIALKDVRNKKIDVDLVTDRYSKLENEEYTLEQLLDTQKLHRFDWNEKYGYKRRNLHFFYKAKDLLLALNE